MENPGFQACAYKGLELMSEPSKLRDYYGDRLDYDGIQRRDSRANTVQSCMGVNMMLKTTLDGKTASTSVPKMELRLAGKV